MIKGRLDKSDGTKVLLLGLTKINLARLQDDQPIVITARDMEQLGLPGIEIALIAGDTEASLSAQLGGMPLQPEVKGQKFMQRPKP